jgi:hypothetical protein
MAFPVRTVPLPTFLLPLTTFLPVLVVPVLTDLAKREDREPNENVSKYHGDQTDPLSNRKDEFSSSRQRIRSQRNSQVHDRLQQGGSRVDNDLIVFLQFLVEPV